MIGRIWPSNNDTAFLLEELSMSLLLVMKGGCYFDSSISAAIWSTISSNSSAREHLHTPYFLRRDLIWQRRSSPFSGANNKAAPAPTIAPPMNAAIRFVAFMFVCFKSTIIMGYVICR